jgi:hypothetical protein
MSLGRHYGRTKRDPSQNQKRSPSEISGPLRKSVVFTQNKARQISDVSTAIHIRVCSHFKTGHSQNQIRPLRVETGEYPSVLGFRAVNSPSPSADLMTSKKLPIAWLSWQWSMGPDSSALRRPLVILRTRRTALSVDHLRTTSGTLLWSPFISSLSPSAPARPGGGWPDLGSSLHR